MSVCVLGYGWKRLDFDIVVYSSSGIENTDTIVYCCTRYNAYMCGYSILSYARIICMHDGLWYGITVQLKQTISTYYGAINMVVGGMVGCWMDGGMDETSNF